MFKRSIFSPLLRLLKSIKTQIKFRYTNESPLLISGHLSSWEEVKMISLIIFIKGCWHLDDEVYFATNINRCLSCH